MSFIPISSHHMAQSLHLGMTPWSLRDSHTAQILGYRAQLGEAWGFESFWLPEHHFTPGSSIPDPLLLLASVASLTSTMRLGTTSYLLPLRQPLLVAEQVAVLDQLSGGRLTLGIGRGYTPQLFDTFGVERSRKRQLLKSCLDIMLRAWSGEVIGEGSAATSIAPLPAQKPHPPIWVAAFGPLALKQAGSLGCPYLSSPMESKRRLHDNLKIHRQACRDAELTIPTEVPFMRTMFCSDDRAEVSRVRERLDAESARMVRATDDIREAVTSGDWAIVGEPSFVRDEVTRYQEELGMTHLIATRLRIGGLSSASLERSLALTAETLKS